MPWDMDPTKGVEFELLDEFEGEIVDCIFTISRPLDPETGEEIGIEVPQLVVKYKVLSPEGVNDQIGFYSMGSRKSFVFGVPAEMTIGSGPRARVITGGRVVEEGPPLNVKSRCWRFFDALAKLGWNKWGNDCRVFIGARLKMKRFEPPEMRGLKESSILLPVAIISKPKETAKETVATAPQAKQSIEERLLALADGKMYKDFLPEAYSIAREAGETALQTELVRGTWLDRMIKEGKLERDEKGVLHRK